jgi:hypothetical protein
MNKKNLEWFKQRIGKRVYRKHNFCKCESCLNTWKEGLIIRDETHADYLFMCECEMDLNYFDKEEPNEQYMIDYNKMEEEWEMDNYNEMKDE